MSDKYVNRWVRIKMRNELAEIETCCKGIIAKADELLDWEWDSYVGAFLATFPVQRAEEVMAICDKYFMSRWNSDSLPDAPPSVRAIAETLGGLRTAQQLLMTRPDQFAMVFGAWWPWGDGQTISLRIGLFTEDVPEYAKAEFFKEFSEWFTNPVAAETPDTLA